VLLSGNELKEAGLPKPSIIKLSKIFTIHQGLIRKKIGHVSDSTRGEILEAANRKSHSRNSIAELSAVERGNNC